jgi:hypothetical protein
MKPFYIVVNPVGSKFAKSLQGAVQKLVVQRVLRVRNPRANRQNFLVTPNVLDKIRQFQAFERDGVSIPEFTTEANNIKGFTSKTVFARTLINSTNGRGIVEFERDRDGEVPRAPLYVSYIPKKAEFRAHVFGGKVIDIQQKRKKRGFDDERNTRIRNLHNGYIYSREGITPPEDLQGQATRAVAACRYQYGAVDIIWNEKQNKSYVLEVNSRPGLMGTTVERYADAIVEMFNLKRK